MRLIGDIEKLRCHRVEGEVLRNLRNPLVSILEVDMTPCYKSAYEDIVEATADRRAGREDAGFEY